MNSQFSSGSSSTTFKERINTNYYSGFPMAGYIPQSIGYSSIQASSKQGASRASSPTLYYHHPINQLQEPDFYCFPDHNHQTLNHHYLCSDDSSQATHHFPNHHITCELDSSSGGSSRGYPVNYNSPSSLSFSPNPFLCITEPETTTDHRDDLIMEEDPTISAEPETWKRVMDVISGKDLKETMIACAEAISDNELLIADLLITELRTMVSVSGDPTQRLGAYILEGLVARMDLTGTCIYKSLKCNLPTGPNLLSYMQTLYEACPYYKFGYISANRTILEAVQHETRIHIIDFQIAQGSQWIPVIQTLSTRPAGPPALLRITGIDDDQSVYARGGGVHLVGRRLAKLAESCHVSFEFHAAAVSGSEVQLSDLVVRANEEAVVVNFPFVLHHVPDESVSTENHRDRVLRMVKSLSPKVVTLAEQESNTNTSAFLPRFHETLSFYTAMFESVDESFLARDSKERINVEQNCLARDVVSIIACEGADRVERHELLGKWRSRLRMAGFSAYTLSDGIKGCVMGMLEKYSHKYRLEERDGALFLGWMNKRLFTYSAWR